MQNQQDEEYYHQRGDYYPSDDARRRGSLISRTILPGNSATSAIASNIGGSIRPAGANVLNCFGAVALGNCGWLDVLKEWEDE
jgi:hypothetical protein